MPNLPTGERSRNLAPRLGRQPSERKRMALLVSIAMLILFPDAILLLVLKLLYVAASGLSLMLKHALQEAFDLSRHTAQMFTAWLEAAAVVGFNVWLFRRLNARVQAGYLGWLERRQARTARDSSRT